MAQNNCFIHCYLDDNNFFRIIHLHSQESNYHFSVVHLHAQHYIHTIHIAFYVCGMWHIHGFLHNNMVCIQVFILSVKCLTMLE